MNQESEKMTKSKLSLLRKGDWIILLVVFCVLMVLLFFISKRKQGDLVHITVMNGHMMTYSMWEDRRISVTEDGNIIEHSADSTDDVETNCIAIENGQVYMDSAVCPDQICVRHRAISKNGEMIICLPNKVFIEVESNKENEIDN